MSNYQEYLAGTNPTNGASWLGIISVTATGDDVVVNWTTVGGRATPCKPVQWQMADSPTCPRSFLFLALARR